MNKNSVCYRCNNKPCKNMETITPDSSFLISAQFRLSFDWIDGKMYISKCSGLNKKDFYYIAEDDKNP